MITISHNLGGAMHSRLQLGTKEAADVIGISVKTLCQWRMRRIGPPFFKLPNGMVFYNKNDIDEWVENLRNDPNGS